jgi:hypothetical protein
VCFRTASRLWRARERSAIHKLKQSEGRVIFAQDVIVAETQERLATLRIPLVLQ